MDSDSDMMMMDMDAVLNDPELNRELLLLYNEIGMTPQSTQNLSRLVFAISELLP